MKKTPPSSHFYSSQHVENGGEKILPHRCVTLIYRYMRIYPDLVKKLLKKTSFFIQCPCKQNFVFRIKSKKEKPILKDFIGIFAPFTHVFTPGGTKTS